MSAIPKYQQILQALRQAIASGEYKNGDRIPSEADLVQQFGASRLTVGRALRELQAEGIVDRRAGSGTYVREPQTSARHLLFGLLIPDLGQTEIFEPICKGMAEARQSSAYSLIWGKASHGAQSKEMQAEQLAEHYIEKEVSGVFFAPLELTAEKDEVNHRIVKALDAAGIPLILLDRDIFAYPRRSRYDIVGIDNRRAGFAVTEHLLNMGCKRICFIGRPSSAPTVDARIAGYREALYAYGAEFSPDYIQRVDPADEPAIAAIVQSQRPDAFVSANDYTAGVLMRSLAALGVRIPRQIRIVGIDDVKYASLLPVSLTTVHQPCREIGAAAVAAMLERLAEPATPARDILLDFQLIVRESCGAESSGRSRKTLQTAT
jgi:GntR family transcriptional regulator, arabinose operon transcriptional repressor